VCCCRCPGNESATFVVGGSGGGLGRRSNCRERYLWFVRMEQVSEYVCEDGVDRMRVGVGTIQELHGHEMMKV
jgi:hypothetical protein